MYIYLFLLLAVDCPFILWWILSVQPPFTTLFLKKRRDKNKLKLIQSVTIPS